MFAGINRDGIRRRELLKGAAAAGLSIIAMPLAPRRAAAADELTVLEWAGYEEPSLRPEFTERHGNPSFSFFAEEEEALQKLLQGFRADLAHPCNYVLPRWQAAGVVRPIDTSRIPRWNSIIPQLLELDGVQQDGEIWFMPYDWGFSTIGYRTDMVDEESATYEIAVDPDFERRFGMNSQLDAALMIAGQIAGFENIFDPNEEEMGQLPELFRRLVRNGRFLWSDQTEIENAIANREVVGGYLWSSSIMNLRSQGIPMGIIEPVFTWACGFVLPEGNAGNDELAYEYLNALLDPEGGKELINWGYGHSVQRSFELADQTTIETLGFEDLEAFFQRGKKFDPVPHAKRDLINAMWEQARLG